MPTWFWGGWGDDTPRRPLRLHGGTKRDRSKVKAQRAARKRARR